MTAKEYLSKIQTYRRAVQTYADRIEELYHDASGLKAIVYDKDRVQVSPENKLEKIFEKIDREAEKYAKARLKLEAEVQKRVDQIAGLERAEYAELLRMRYIEDMNLLQITLAMKDKDGGQRYSYDHVKHMHGWALSAFQKKYLNNTK